MEDRLKPKKAVVAEKGEEKVIITLFEDGAVQVCYKLGPKEHECYSDERGGEALYYLAQAWYAGLGFKVKPVELGE